MAKKTVKKVPKRTAGAPAKSPAAKPVPKTARVVAAYTPKARSARIQTTATSLGSHVYMSLWAPEGCTAYEAGTRFSINVAEPPDEYVTVNMGTGCNPVFAQLDE